LTSKYIVLSNRQFDEISTITSNKVFLLYNSIQESELFFNSSPFNKSNKIRVIFFSNFLKEKGFFDLLEVFSILEERFPGCFLLECYGEFANVKDQQSLKSQLQTKNTFLYNSVYGSDKNNVLNSADLIVLPSYNEGMPLILLEALYLGKPIIISRVGYINEALGQKYPLYCKAGDIDSIVRCFVDFKDYYSTSDLCLDLKNKYDKFSLQEHKKTLLNIFNK
jgi:glycosyltransferase involved in cell wall biosynthesis